MVGISLVVFSTTLVRAFALVPAWTEDTSAGSYAPATSTASIPIRLSIPSLEIDARVQRVGRTGKGNIGIPTNYRDVAWYKDGPAPGTSGTAILTGHVDNGLALPGVFKRLGEIRAGDDVYVLTRDRRQLRFVVYDVRSYPYQHVPMKDIVAPREDAQLVLISCEGAWLRHERTYDRRIVVYAKLADTQ